MDSPAIVAWEVRAEWQVACCLLPMIQNVVLSLMAIPWVVDQRSAGGKRRSEPNIIGSFHLVLALDNDARREKSRLN